MRIRSLPPIALVIALAVLLVTVGCGGGDDDGAEGGSAGGGGSDSSGASTASSGGGGSGGGASGGSRGAGGMTVGAPTQSADPGQSWADVDGQRLSYEANGSINYACMVTDDVIAVNYQTPGGHDFWINASLQGGVWVGTISLKPGDGANVQYGGSIPGDVTTLGVGGNAVSYEGTVDKVTGVDVTNAETLDVTIAVNCASAGGDPSAVIDGTSYVFPTSGAQSVTCNVAEDRIEVRINRLSIDNLQLEIDATGPQWLGAAVVYAGEARFTSTLPADGEGLTIEGGSVSYEGTFVDADGTEVEGTIEVTCS